MGVESVSGLNTGVLWCFLRIKSLLLRVGGVSVMKWCILLWFGVWGWHCMGSWQGSKLKKKGSRVILQLFGT